MKGSRHVVAVLAMIAAVSSAIMAPALAESSLPKFDPKDMVPLAHGPNWVDLDGDGRKDLVVKSRVTINSPHSMSFYSFHIWAGEHPVLPSESPFALTEPRINWYAVSFPDRSPPLGDFTVNSYQGADCMTNDYRLVVTAGKPGQKHRDAYLIRASREPGESFADPAPVTFSIYHLERGSMKALNEFAFIKTTEFKASKPYCSVINAFKDELGLPSGDPALDDYDYEPPKH
jgi:hypothetical protein